MHERKKKARKIKRKADASKEFIQLNNKNKTNMKRKRVFLIK